MVGLFINTLPVRIGISSQDSIIDWLHRVQAESVELQQYEHTSLAEIQGWSELARGSALFETLLVFESYPMDQSIGEVGAGLGVSEVRFSERTNYPLTLTVLPGSPMTLRISYDAHLLSQAAVMRMLKHLEKVLGSVVADPGQRVGELSLLSEAEEQRMLEEWNATGVGFEQLWVHELFARQCEKTGDAVAVVSGSEHVSYGELERRAGQLAGELRRRGVGAEVRVGICMERSVELMVGLMGILKAGGAYVPLDPDYPRERLGYMVEDAGIEVLVTQPGVGERVETGEGCQRVVLEAGWGKAEEAEKEEEEKAEEAEEKNEEREAGGEEGE